MSQQVWQDFKKQRKTLRAAITKSAIDGIRREADKAGWSMEAALAECCARGWRGFKSDWVGTPGANKTLNKQEALEARNRAVVERLLAKEQNAAI